MSTIKWEADKVLSVWTVEVDDVSLIIRRHGKHRFSWATSCSFNIESGIDEVCGTARSLREAKAMALAAVCMMEDELCL